MSFRHLSIDGASYDVYVSSVYANRRRKLNDENYHYCEFANPFRIFSFLLSACRHGQIVLVRRRCHQFDGVGHSAQAKKQTYTFFGFDRAEADWVRGTITNHSLAQCFIWIGKVSTHKVNICESFANERVHLWQPATNSQHLALSLRSCHQNEYAVVLCLVNLSSFLKQPRHEHTLAHTHESWINWVRGRTSSRQHIVFAFVLCQFQCAWFFCAKWRWQHETTKITINRTRTRKLRLTDNFAQCRLLFAAHIAILLVHILRTLATVTGTIFGYITFITCVSTNNAALTELKIG